MFLKVSDGENGWHTLEVGARAHVLGSVNYAIKTKEDLTKVLTEHTICLIPKNQIDGVNLIDVSIVEFYDEQKLLRRVLLSTLAFLCNDRGDTLERISSGKKGR